MTLLTPLKVTRLNHAKDLDLPKYQSRSASGMDLCAAVKEDEPIILRPGQRQLIPTGLTVELPEGMEAQVRPRSGLALKHGITVLNSPGTIDADYRGEISVLLINHGDQDFEIFRGSRVAQLVIAIVIQAEVTEVDSLSTTDRGAGGYGSTGIN